MQPVQVVSRITGAATAALAALQQAAHVADEIDAIGGVSVLQSHMTAPGVSESLGFGYTDVQNAVSTLGLMRSLARNAAANFGAGSGTNLYRIRS